MNIAKLACVSALVAASAVLAQTVDFTGVIEKTPASNAYPLIGGSYDISFDTTSGAINGAGAASTISTSVLKPGPAPVYAITTVRIFEGATEVLSINPGSPSQTYFNTATRTRTKADYTFNITGTLGGNKTYHFEFYNGGTKIATSATFTTPALVPEPETYAAVAALGLVGFGLWRRRNA